ncbi:MAG: aldo/keto reductase [Rubrivivax sp.]|nr:aldo/keto reductase [Rubrivivax sp.]
MNTPSAATSPVYRPLGASGLKVPPLWLGTMLFGEQTSEAEAASLLAATRERGLHALDTADIYTGGESERIVGRLVKADRERWLIASKAANPIGSDPNDRGTSRRWLTRAVEASLARLNTDVIDLYYLHRDDATTPVEETVTTMARLVERGRILYWGLSNFRAWRVATFVETARRLAVPAPVACQPPYSLVTRGVEAELLPACAHHGLGVVCYSPLARGVLSGKYGAGGAAPPADSRAARSDKRLLQTEWRPESLRLAQEFKALAEARGVSPTPLAIAWVLANRLVSGVIGGPRTLAQWRDYLAALDVKVGPADEAWVDARVPPGHASTFGYTDPVYPVTGRQPRDG